MCDVYEKKGAYLIDEQCLSQGHLTRFQNNQTLDFFIQHEIFLDRFKLYQVKIKVVWDM